MNNYPFLAGVNYESMADGEGVRTTIFLSGCSHHCLGCQNREAQSENFGTEVTDAIIDEIASGIIVRPFLEGITLSGGDPLFCPEKTNALVNELMVRLQHKNLNLWLYTGYAWEEVRHKMGHDAALNQLVSRCSVLVDGRFVRELADKTLLFRGSSNQRLIDVPQSIVSCRAVLWQPRSGQ